MEEVMNESFRLILVRRDSSLGEIIHRFFPDKNDPSIAWLKRFVKGSGAHGVRYVAILRNPGNRVSPNYSGALAQAIRDWGSDVRRALDAGSTPPNLVERLLTSAGPLGRTTLASKHDNLQTLLAMETPTENGDWRDQVLDALKDYSGGPLLEPISTGLALPPLQPAARGYGQLELF